MNMAGHSIKNQCQSPLKCDVCEIDNDTVWYCLDCKGSLCSDCKTKHEVPLFRKHTVVSITEGLRQRLQEPEQCSRHPSLQYTHHCENCSILVCADCITTDHKGHILGSISEAIGKVQEEIKKFSEKLRSTVLKDCITQDDTLAEDISKCENWYTTLETNVNKSGADLKIEIDLVCKSLLEEAMEEKKKYVTGMTEAKQDFQKTIGELQHTIKKSEDIQALTDSEKIDFYKENLDINDLSVPTYTSDPLGLPEFVPGKVNTAQIREQIGKLQERKCPQVKDKNLSKIEIITTKTHACGQILSIFPISSTEVFIGSPNSSYIQRVNISGDVKESIETMYGIYSFAVMSTGDVIISNYENGYIKVLKQTGDVAQIIYTDTWKPTGLSLTKDGNRLVCLNSKDESKSKLVVYSTNWTILLSIQYTEKPVGLHVSQSVTQNKNDDYCIVHTGQHTVFVLDSKGIQRFSYNESNCGKMEMKFTPVSVCCDMYSNILITDCYNRTIHILDQNGMFLRYLQNELISFGHVHGMSIDTEGKFWIGHGDGKLSVVKYIDN